MKRSTSQSVFQKLAGRVDEIAVKVEGKNLAGNITRIGEGADEGTLAGMAFTNEHDFFH